MLQKITISWGGGVLSRHHLTLAVDLGWVALSAMLAVLIRDNFIAYESHLEAASAYAAIAVASCAVIFASVGIHKTLWQYTALPDVLRITAAVAVALLVALFLSFALSRLEGVARSVPVIHWLLLVSAMVGTRVGLRIWHERRRRDHLLDPHASVQHVLVVGLSHLTELYLQSVAEYASKTVDIVGILSEQHELRGRLLRFHKILGTPEELPQVMTQLEVHGITLERIVVMQPFEQLSPPARAALLEIEKASSVRVDWIAELLGLTVSRRSDVEQTELSLGVVAQPSFSEALSQESSSSYGALKRAFDILGVIFLSLALLPLIVAVGALVAIDVGFPIVFWQKRPGKFGRPFKLFKFCTMRPAHDGAGNRLSDDMRSSVVGRFLRGSRLDEIPQLYNILTGEMSFVGPRPLLPPDQPMETNARQLVRPGLTGMAQVFGTRDISPEDKNALDIWYVQHASLWLDIKILVRTPLVMLRGERVDQRAVRTARKGFERLMDKNVDSGSHQIRTERVKTERATANRQAARALG